MQVVERFFYIGPNRRSEKTVNEWQLKLTVEDVDAFDREAKLGLHGLRDRLDEFAIQKGFDAGHDLLGLQDSERTTTEIVARLIADLAVAMQLRAGHRVAFSGIVTGEHDYQCGLLFEYEFGGAGEDAGDLAMSLLEETVVGLSWEHDENIPGAGFDEAFKLFLERAAESVLPFETQAIIDAAVRFDVPCVKLEREPYGQFEAGFRIRRNGLLKLGHCIHQHVLDGTICIDRSADLIPLLLNAEMDKKFKNGEL